MNPFTGKSQDALIWVADPADDDPVEPFAGATLGQRLCKFAQVQLKGLDPLMLAELLAVAVGGDVGAWLTRIGNPPPLVNVEDSETEHLFFWELPEAFVAALASYGPAESVEVGGGGQRASRRTGQRRTARMSFVT